MRSRRMAEDLAEKLLNQMKGSGWKLKIWENLGWHYCVCNGPLQVHPSSIDDSYFTLLDGDGSGGGSPCYSVDTNFNDPNEAVRVQLETARLFVNSQDEIVRKLEEKINGV